MRKFLLGAALSLMATVSFGQSQKNFNLLDQVTPPSDLNDCWGWWDGNGKEYVVAGVQSGGEIIVDISTPSNSQIVQTLPGISSTWRDLKSYGNYVYVVNESDDGIRIIDMTGLPGSVNYKDTVIHGISTAHNIYVESNYLYVCGSNTGAGGIEVMDLTDPWHPNYVGEYQQNYVHDMYVRNDTAYAGELSSGLTIIDFTNKANPQIIGNRPYQGNFTHNTWLNDDGDVCFTTDEVAQGWLIAWDVSDMNNITELDRLRNSLSQGQSIPHNAHVINDYIVTSWYTDGIHMVDADRPHNLIEVGYYDTSPSQPGVFDGDWGAFPFFPSGTVVASDQQGGLFVFGPNYVRGCYLEGMVIDAATLNPISGADIEIIGTTITDKSNTLGEFATGVADSGSYQVAYSAFGYESDTIIYLLDNGQLILDTVPLIPIARVSVTINVVESGTLTPIPNAQVHFEASTGQQLSYMADANGQVTDTSFVQGQYEVYAGRWGWHANVDQMNANANQSLTIELDPGYYDEFVLDLGWTVGSSASSGEWVRDEPIGTSLFSPNDMSPDEDNQGDLGDQCYITGNGGGGAGDDDIDGGVTNLICPSMDLSAYNNPVIHFDRFFANAGGFGGNPNDSLLIILDNGINSVTALRIYGQNENVWKPDSVVILDYISLTSNMKVRFSAGDYSPGHIAEAAIDVFGVSEGPDVANDPGIVDEGGYLRVFPNPLTENSMVEYDLREGQGAVFEVRDLQGRVLYRRALSDGHGRFALDFEAPSGMYLGVVRTAQGEQHSFKMIR